MISQPQELEGLYRATQALGAKSINSDGQIEIEGFPQMSLLMKQFPWPTLGAQGEIEVPMPLGARAWEAQQLNVAQQGPVQITETRAGSVMDFMEQVVAGGGKFKANVYEGTVERFARGYRLVDCIFVPDQPDRDWENRAQITLISGTLFFHFFGGKIQGNMV